MKREEEEEIEEKRINHSDCVVILQLLLYANTEHTTEKREKCLQFVWHFC